MNFTKGQYHLMQQQLGAVVVVIVW